MPIKRVCGYLASVLVGLAYLCCVARAQDQATADQVAAEPFAISLADVEQVPEEFHRQEVPYDTIYPAGTVVVDADHRFLYYVLAEGRAIRYGIGVGRAGFEWNGNAEIGRKTLWPMWFPPKAMVARDKFARKWRQGMPGGPKNPLGARALYLYANGKDTLYRIHGTNQPSSIGQAVSSGCVRMLNSDVVDLYERVTEGTKVVVMATPRKPVVVARAQSHKPKLIKITRNRPVATAGLFQDWRLARDQRTRKKFTPNLVRKRNFNLTKTILVSN
jgi:lipoprotein-anchoring transpeptidase ErfK/SrfK